MGFNCGQNTHEVKSPPEPGASALFAAGPPPLSRAFSSAFLSVSDLKDGSRAVTASELRNILRVSSHHGAGRAAAWFPASHVCCQGQRPAEGRRGPRVPQGPPRTEAPGWLAPRVSTHRVMHTTTAATQPRRATGRASRELKATHTRPQGTSRSPQVATWFPPKVPLAFSTLSIKWWENLLSSSQCVLGEGGLSRALRRLPQSGTCPGAWHRAEKAGRWDPRHLCHAGQPSCTYCVCSRLCANQPVLWVQ